MKILHSTNLIIRNEYKAGTKTNHALVRKLKMKTNQSEKGGSHLQGILAISNIVLKGCGNIKSHWNFSS